MKLSEIWPHGPSRSGTFTTVVTPNHGEVGVGASVAICCCFQMREQSKRKVCLEMPLPPAHNPQTAVYSCASALHQARRGVLGRAYCTALSGNAPNTRYMSRLHWSIWSSVRNLKSSTEALQSEVSCFTFLL